MSIPQNELDNVIGSTVFDNDGNKIGEAGDVYMDDQTGQAEWLAVNTGFFGTKVSFVPISGASFSDDKVTVPFSSDQVKGAPNADADGSLSQDEEAQLYSHYGVKYSESESDSGLPAGGVRGEHFSGNNYSDSESNVDTDTDTDTGTVGYDTSGPTTDKAMTRSEEELNVGTERRETGKARLRKYVVTEQKTVTVPVSREEVRVEREAITDENYEAATDGPEISEEEHEVVLSEEVPVVDTKVVPKERVRLDTETVTDEREVSADLRKEQIDVDDSELDKLKNN